uniref:nitroreductase family protein n=1 Tax=Stenotrophomonas sp. YIM B06876 TaxID=3060211 RepID=UPI0027394118
VAQARDKAYRAPELMLLVVDGHRGNAGIDLHERLLSAGCALQNMLLMATALGYGSALTSGKALKDAGLRQLFGLGAGEHALCFLSLGTVQSRKRARVRPVPADYLSVLGTPGAAPPFNTTP